MQLRTTFTAFSVFALLAGCAGPSISPEERVVLERPARTLEAQGDWQGAATTWLRTSKKLKGAIAAELQLNAADALLQAGDGAGAKRIASALVADDLTPALRSRHVLIRADAAILSGDPMEALRQVGANPADPSPATVARFRRIRADALEMTGDTMGASRERVLRDRIVRGIEERYRNRQRIWNLLGQASIEQLESPLPPPISEFDGWVELATLTRRNLLDIAQLELAISEWSTRYPGHPAGEEIVPEVLELARVQAQPPSKVALLLPQTGPFAAVSAAIREGFMAAWYADAPNEHRPEIIMADTNLEDPALAYSNAVNDGAQFIIGPLSKESVAALLDGVTLDVTTLALNYPTPSAATQPVLADATGAISSGAQGDSDPVSTAAAVDSPQMSSPEIAAEQTERERNLQRVHFFVLSPEDEARRAAEHAYQAGARHAASLLASGTWGERVGAAFAERWNELGGAIVASTTYPEEAQGLSAAVEQLLNINRSKARAKQLRSVLVRNLKHEPQPRSDVDVIFIAGFPQAARQLRPLLLFHRAGDVPVLATSHVYAGVTDAQADQDLNGVVFAEMPWLLSPDAHSLPGQLRNLWPQSGGPLGRLYAFGADSYALISHLRELRVAPNSSYSGLTGDLSLDAERHIRRDMQWSHFVEGLPLPVNTEANSLLRAVTAQ
ncbi:MAG: outer membrane PBP1 activator LpoA protein [Gammaproteobacteria bacterium]|jgi:outer membrane PBP1 activator LpoA protein